MLGEGSSDAVGRFSLSPAKVRASEFHWVQLLARSAQSGLAWRAVNPDIREAEFKIELAKTRVMRGRLISLESAPAAGVKVLVDKIGHKGPGEFLGVDSMLAKLPSTVWPHDVVTDADGWFAVPGVAEGCDLNLRVSQEPYAPAWWLWDAGDAATHVHPLSPAQVITGVVVAADTQDPVPFARLTAFQAWDPNRGGMMGVDGQADAQGRFRLNPFPANGFVVTGFATPGTPYLARKVEFDWPKAAREHELRVELPRGVLLQGTITAVPDSRPIAGAAVQYEPGQKNRFAKEHLVNGWQATAASDAKGHYAIAVPPGAGSIRVMCPGGDCVVEQLSESQLFEGKPGGRRVYVHAHAMLDLPEDAREQTLNLQVQRGVRFEARIEGIDGRTPDTTLVAYQGMAAPWDHLFGHIPRTIHGGKLEIASVPPQGELTVILLDPVGKQGCVYTVRGKDAAKPQVIRLEKCASAEMRCLDADGKPVPGSIAMADHGVHARAIAVRGRHAGRRAFRRHRLDRELRPLELLGLDQWRGRRAQDAGADTGGRISVDGRRRQGTADRQRLVRAGSRRTQEIARPGDQGRRHLAKMRRALGRAAEEASRRSQQDQRRPRQIQRGAAGRSQGRPSGQSPRTRPSVTNSLAECLTLMASRRPASNCRCSFMPVAKPP